MARHVRRRHHVRPWRVHAESIRLALRPIVVEVPACVVGELLCVARHLARPFNDGCPDPGAGC